MSLYPVTYSNNFISNTNQNYIRVKEFQWLKLTLLSYNIAKLVDTNYVSQTSGWQKDYFSKEKEMRNITHKNIIEPI